MSTNDEQAKKQESKPSEAEKPAESQVKGDESSAKPSETITIEKSKYEKLTADLEAMSKEAAKWKNEYYLSMADTQNLRKSLEADHAEAIRYRSAGFLEGLLPALDSFFVALSATPKDVEAKNYQQGFQYIYNQIQNTLTNEGVTEILPKAGDKFDAAFMHAVDVTEGEAEGTIAKIYSKGYKLHDRLIRPVMVSVYKKKDKEKPAEATSASSQKDSEAHKA